MLALIGLAIGNNSLVDILAVVNFSITLVGLYSYVYKKTIFKKTFWLYLFWLNVVWDIAYVLYTLAPNDEIVRNLGFLANYHPENMFMVMVFVVLDVPLLYAIYQLSKHTSKSKKK